MGTRSTIAVVHRDGSVTQCYCHWDGYIDNNGKLLVENYNSLELAEGLVMHGDMSSLGKYAEPNGVHSYNSPEKDVTVYYGRDRGEPAQFTRARHFKDMDDYRENMQSEEYDYLFAAGAWFVRDHGEFAGVVTELLQQQEEE